MQIDVIVASCNGSAKLRRCLWQYPLRAMLTHGVKVILVDNGSDDDTFDVMQRFANEVPGAVAMQFPLRGQSLAQNAGLRVGSSDLVVFIDDDCIFYDDYFDVLRQKLSVDAVQYGGGEIMIHDRRFDMRVANTHWWRHDSDMVIPPHSLPMPGLVQGANMFFTRALLDRIGGLKPLGPRCTSDSLSAYEASSAGFTGIMMRGPKVQHDHGRLAGSAEADATERHYDRLRGEFYAAVLARGDLRAFDLWRSQFDVGNLASSLRRMREELSGAVSGLGKW